MSEGSKAPPHPPAKTTGPRAIRWWPLWIIFALAAGAMIWALPFYSGHRQDQNIATAIIVVSSLLLFLVWCIFLSRLRARIRFGISGGVLGFVFLGAVLFRFHGMTGDLVPIFEWRWKQTSGLPRDDRSKPALNVARPW